MTFSDYEPDPNDYPPGNPNMPFGYLAGLIAWQGMSDEWEVLSYKDLQIHFSQDNDDYLDEFREWHGKHTGALKKYSLFQYDVDARPDVTHALLKVHMEARVPATVMVFKERIWDRVYKQEKRLEIDETYKLDYGLLREFGEDCGSIGYHCNVWERSEFDLDRARDLFKEDLDALREHLQIEYFSMHGGPTDEHGRSNAQLDFSDIAASMGVTWVHNGRSPSFHRSWDDGGAANPSYRFRIGDCAEAFKVTKPGQRLRCLFHPQYYRCVDSKNIINRNQENMAWFNEMLDAYGERQPGASWATAVTQQPSTRSKRIGASANVNKYRAAKKQWKVSSPAEARLEKTETDGSDTNWFANRYWPETGSYTPHPDIESAVKRAWEPAQPIFINGMSRSGTTLMCGLFDVREDTAMSYELYPNYIIGQGEQMERFIDYLEIAYLVKNVDDETSYKLMNEKSEPDVVRLLACANHSDVMAKDVGELAFEFMRTPSSIYTYTDALRFISAIANLKCVRAGKMNWGCKMQGQFESYHELWPEARYIYIMRDGRDILASQMNTGNFNPEAEKLGNGWRYRINRFQEFLDTTQATGAVIRYEDLVRDPRKALQDLCERIELPFSENMLNHESFDISLLHNPRGQLSADRVAVPIDPSAVGRWRTDLDAAMVDTFMEAAGTAMQQWGYE